MNKTEIDNAKDPDVVVPVWNLIEKNKINFMTVHSDKLFVVDDNESTTDSRAL